ncbi:MAG: acyltransferase [Methylobacteriaceae bacterium]
MTIELEDYGDGNVLEVEKDFERNQHGKIIFRGNGNTLKIGSRCQMRGGQIQVWGGSTVEVGSDCLLGFIDVFANKGSCILVGDGVGFTWTVKLHAHERANLTIGDQCLIAKDTLITVSDMHSLLDVATGDRINPAADVTIEPKVWIAENVRVLKGVTIGSQSVIGACSLVTKDIPRQCVAVGVPARVVREGVTWCHELI